MENNPRLVLTCCCVFLLTSCSTPPITPSPDHIQSTPHPAGTIPAPVSQTLTPPPPKPTAKAETYSVVVNNVPAKELLFALARDAKLNIDINPGIEGMVTLNAINQTLHQILDRIARQIDIRYEINGPNLVISPDTPYLRTYKVDYVNMGRKLKSTMTIATQIASTGGGASGYGGGGSGGGGSGGGGGGGSSSGGNNSTTALDTVSDNQLWNTLIQNIKDILRETDKIIPEGTTEAAPAPATTPPATVSGPGQPPALSTAANVGAVQRTTYREAASVIANPESGTIAVRATSRQHEYIQGFLDRVLGNARRQVLIEATIVEVQLSDKYQQGIDWQWLSSQSGSGLRLVQAANNLSSNPTSTLLTANYQSDTRALGNIIASARLLETFGNVKVLSSPKISVLNNQTAVLKVVDNKVYFTIEAVITPATTTSAQVVTYTSTVNQVPVGFVMTVTPQIDDNDVVTLNIRPTISRITGYVTDPNPALANLNVINRIPEIQTREMESLLKIHSGQIGIMGGLMQDSVNNTKDGLPGVANIPVLGNLLSYRNDTSTKNELVIFLRPVVIKEASLDSDLKSYRRLLPEDDFFKDKPISGPGSARKSKP